MLFSSTRTHCLHEAGKGGYVARGLGLFQHERVWRMNARHFLSLCLKMGRNGLGGAGVLGERLRSGKLSAV